MEIRFLGHAGFQIKIGSIYIIIDPFITGSPNEGAIDLNAVDADYVLLTHAHGDHISDAEYIAKNNDALIISNFEICNYFEKKNCRIHALNHGGKVVFDELKFKYVNAIHTSTFPDGSNGGNPGGFVIWNDTECIYHAGDTALTKDMELIPLTCPPLNAAILPIGDNFTMGYEDGVIAGKFIRCTRIIGCHFDTFEAIKIDKHEAIRCFKEQNMNLDLLEFNETMEI
jgi:L-ascorbate metabolism protein UlaG (beta-lactamase superfamily)